MSNPNIKVTGVKGGRVENSNVAGIVHGGMGNTATTTNNQGSRSITNQGDIGNLATGDNHSGAMSAAVGPTGGTKADPKSLTPAELLIKLKEHHCTHDTIEKFEKQMVSGRLFMQLDDGLLDDLGIDNRIERRKLYGLREEL